jgi:regulator of protease activity HflC (stomatin/prohibitin superfamily)
MVFLLGLVLLLVGTGMTVAARRTRALDRMEEARRPAAAGAMVLMAIGIVVMLSQLIRVVPAGNVGVVDFFGTVSPVSRKAGINLVNPLARVLNFSVKTQELKEVMDVPSKEGLTVQLEISVLYHLDPAKAPDVYRTVGPNYEEIILIPQARSVARGVTASYDARALYTSEREMLSKIIETELQKSVGERGIVIEATPLRRVGLPADLTKAIEEKLRAEQESQRMQFVLEREKQEAERKRIEARGIADFQQIVAQGISEQLLRWKGIEATEKLAASPNAKVVVIGAGKDGLPLILDTK